MWWPFRARHIFPSGAFTKPSRHEHWAVPNFALQICSQPPFLYKQGSAPRGEKRCIRRWARRSKGSLIQITVSSLRGKETQCVYMEPKSRVFQKSSYKEPLRLAQNVITLWVIDWVEQVLFSKKLFRPMRFLFSNSWSSQTEKGQLGKKNFCKTLAAFSICSLPGTRRGWRKAPG